MSENSLHAGLKTLLRLPDDKLETPVERFIIDIVRDQTLFEIQTKNFYALRQKLDCLLPNYKVCVIHPIAVQKWIRRIGADSSSSKRRKSPKHGRIYNIFYQLIYIPDYLLHPNFSVEVCLVEQEDVWKNDGKGSWRRKGWSLCDQHLLRITGRITFSGAADYLGLLPGNLPEPFGNSHLANALGIPVVLARKMTYTLYRAGMLKQTGKQGRANMYCQTDE